MAALLVTGIILGIDKVQRHREEKRQKATATQRHRTREEYFHSSKAEEAAKERRRARRRERREAGGLDGSGSEGASDSDGESDGEGGAAAPPPPYVGSGFAEKGESSSSGNARTVNPSPATTRVEGASLETVPSYGDHVQDRQLESSNTGIVRDRAAPSTSATSSASTDLPRWSATAGSVSETEMERQGQGQGHGRGKKSRKFWKNPQTLGLIGAGFAR